jgi:hypothetical protein
MDELPPFVAVSMSNADSRAIMLLLFIRNINCMRALLAPAASKCGDQKDD